MLDADRFRFVLSSDSAQLLARASGPSDSWSHTLVGGPTRRHRRLPGAGRAGVSLVVAYQPANRDWTFQWIEAGIFLGLALLAGAACYWWITRRAA